MDFINFNDEKVLIQITGDNLRILASMIAEAVLNYLPQQEAQVSDENLSIHDLCNRWNVSKGTVGNYVKAGIVTPIKLGRRVLFPMSEVMRAESNCLKLGGGR